MVIVSAVLSYLFYFEYCYPIQLTTYHVLYLHNLLH